MYSISCRRMWPLFLCPPCLQPPVVANIMLQNVAFVSAQAPVAAVTWPWPFSLL